MSVYKVATLINRLQQEGCTLTLTESKSDFKVMSRKGVYISESLKAEIRENHDEILEFLLEFSNPNDHPQSIEKRPAGMDELELSREQERIWVLDQLDEYGLYNTVSILFLKGKVDIQSLNESLRSLIDRHEVFRTVIVDYGSNRVQRILQHFEWSLEVILKNDIQPNSNDLNNEIYQRVYERFDLSCQLPIKAILFSFGNDVFKLVIIIHHIASDAWSMAIVMRELTEIYNSLIRRSELQLKPQLIQYGDYAYWQNKNIQTEREHVDKEYWKKTLKNLPTSLLPGDLIRPHVFSYKGAVINFAMEELIVNKVKSFSKENNVTVYTTLMTLFKLLLFRYLDQDEICIGTATANRDHTDVQDIPGFFVNMVPLRSKIDASLTFIELLDKEKSNFLEAYGHSALPFEMIVDAVSPERSTSYSQIFQNVFVFQSSGDLILPLLEGIHAEYEPIPRDTAKYDMTFTVSEQVRDYNVEIEFYADVFSSDFIVRFYTHYINLLNEVISSPTKLLSEYIFMAKSEIDQILTFSDNRQWTYPHSKSIVDLFTSAAMLYRDNEALIFQGKSMSYRELDIKSNQLAHFLSEKGIKPESLVPVCMYPSFELIICILGVLKAGAAYVPIDPDYPKTRIEFILSECSSGYILTTSRVEGLDVILKNDLIIDIHKVLQQDYPENALDIFVKPQNLAYVIYTSGSTGKPKGVMIEHSNVVRLFFPEKSLFDFSSIDVWLLAHSFSFDFSVWEIFGALLHGGVLVIPEKEQIKEMNQLSELLKKHQVTVLNQTPTAFYGLAEYIINYRLELNLRYVIFGGESLFASRLQEWKRMFPDCILVNMYGITETTVHVTYHRITIDDMNTNRNLIGKPIPTLAMYVMDRFHNLLPFGVPGELYVGGLGIARGYLNRPDLNADRFITSSKNAIGRLYKSGDKARLLDCGTFEYLGRNDDQVKIRGFRIELGEIISVIMAHMHILNCSIDATLLNEERTLTAFIKVREDFDRVGFENYLAASLPSFMIPTRIIKVRDIPITNNGKVDKKLLLAQEDGLINEDSIDDFKTELSLNLRQIFRMILGIVDIRPHDNFFDLGGDSIKAIRLVNAIKKEFNCFVRAFEIYRENTVEKLSKLLLSRIELIAQQEEKSAIVNEIGNLALLVKDRLNNPENVLDVYPMSDIQSGMIYKTLMYNNEAMYLDQMTFDLPANIQLDLLNEAFRLLVDKHEILRTSFNLDIYSEGIQVVHKSISFSIENQYAGSMSLDDSEKWLNGYLHQSSLNQFDLTKAPLWRISIVDFVDFKVLVFECHHAILDGWSVASLYTEVSNLYNRLRTKMEVGCTLLKCSNKDFIIRSLLEKVNNKGRSEWWFNEMEGYKRLNIFSRELCLEKHVFSFDSKTFKEIRQKTRQYSLSLKSLIFGAYLYALKMFTYDKDVTVGLVSNVRPDIDDGDKLLGCFLNTIPFRFGNFGNCTWIEYFRLIDSKLLLLKNYDLSTLFEITKFTNESVADGNPFFDALFNFVDFHIYDEIENDSNAYNTGKGLRSRTLEYNTTFLHCTANITGDELKISYLLRRKFSPEISLENFHSYVYRIITAFLDHANRQINHKEVIVPEQVAMMLNSFNQNIIPIDSAATIVEMFDNQVARVPDAIALEFMDKKISYYELKEMADSVCRQLIKSGAAPGTLIAICVERSIEMITAILGVLKSGAAYIPIEHNCPKIRAEEILSTALPISIIVSEVTRNIFEEVQTCEVISIGPLEANNEFGDYSIHNKATLNELAYVIYTSGSTGDPKGVMMSHRSISNYLNYQIKYFNLCSKERIVLFANYSFDASIEQIFLPLITGNTLVVIPEQLKTDVQRFERFLDNERITHLHCTPGFLSTLPAKRYDCLRRVVCGGEEFLPHEAAKWKDLVRLYNKYGPTECCITVCETEILNTFKDAFNSIPIGRPVSNNRIYILDQTRQLMPMGCIGEIYVAGVQVSSGYLNNPSATNDTIVADQFFNDFNQQMYRTGDLGRWLNDGMLEFVGRIDNQVKIRGFRIELEEIEKKLSQAPGVRSCAVVAAESKRGDKRIVAFVVPTEQFKKVSAVKNLLERLPEYMIPSEIVTVEKLDYTTSDKIDKTKLIIPNELFTSRNEYIPPNSPMEKTLSEIWGDLLGSSTVGLDDNFFELGGDSIISIQVVSRSRRKGYYFQVADIFTYPTIRELSNVVVSNSEIKDFSLSENGTLIGECGLLPIQYTFFKNESGNLSQYNQVVLLKIHKHISEVELNPVVKQIIIDHDALRFVYRKTGNGWKQLYGDGQGSVEIVDLHTNEGLLENELLEISIRAQESLNIHRGVLTKFVLIRTSSEEEENRLLIVIHHLAVDGVSWRIILEDLSAYLEDQLTHQIPRKLQKTSSYRDYYNHFSRIHLSANAEQYWQKLISSYQRLPVDFNIDRLPTYGEMAKEEATLTIDLSTKLIRDVPLRFGVSVKDVLFTALVLTLRDWTRLPSITVGIESHGRDLVVGDLDLSRTVGWFTNIFPVNVPIFNTEDIPFLLKSVKYYFENIPDQGLSYTAYQIKNNYVNCGNDFNWDIVFNYLGHFNNSFSGHGLLAIANENVGRSISPTRISFNKMHVDTWFVDGKYTVNWSFSSVHYNSNTAVRLISRYLNFLELIINYKALGEVSELPIQFVNNEENNAVKHNNYHGFKDFPRKKKGYYTLTGLQEGMLFHSLYQRFSGSYVQQMTFDIVDLNLIWFHMAWEKIMSRHDILRSCFTLNGDFPARIIMENCVIRCKEIDLVNENRNGQEHFCAEFLDKDREQGFDFMEAPLMRFTALKFASNKHRLIWTTHHILLDGWSQQILFKEFIYYYHNLSSIRELISNSNRDAFDDLLCHIDSIGTKKQEEFWTTYLSQIKSGCSLPFVKNRASSNFGISKFSSKNIYLPKNLYSELVRFSTFQKITLNTLFQATLSFLLHKYLDRDHVVFGVVVSGRPPELENVEERVGMYINIVPLHSFLNSTIKVSDWLGKFMSDQKEMFEFQHSRLDHIRGWLKFKEEYFDTIFTFQNYPSLTENISSTSFTIEDIKLYEQTTNYPLSVRVTLNNSSPFIEFIFKEDVLNADDVERFSDHFLHVLRQMIQYPDYLLKDLEILDFNERSSIMKFSEGFENSLDKNATVVDLFRKNVKLYPHSAALIYSRGELSYGQLNMKVNQIVFNLKKNGVKPGDLVPIVLGSSPELIVAIFGVLTLGATYVPVDVNSPIQRIGAVFKETNAQVFVTCSSKTIELEDISPAKQVIIDDVEGLTGIEQEMESLAHSESEAYVIFTSGSTGKSKGVVIRHNSLMNYLINALDMYVDDSTKASMTYSYLPYTFDASITALFLPLISGHALIIGENQDANKIFDSELFKKYSPFNFLKLTPAHLSIFKEFINQNGNEYVPQKLVIGGDVLQYKEVEGLLTQKQDLIIINEYGPTETTVGVSTFKIVNPLLTNSNDNVPIGTPMKNVQLYVLDQKFQLMPFGAPGELFVGGIQVMQGYLNDKLNNQLLLDNPINPGSKYPLYRTGDICKISADGNLHFLGRTDHQVKIRGYRVNLLEIDLYIQNAPGVMQAFTSIYEDGEKNKCIAANILPSSEFNLDKMALFLKDNLPSYMIPTNFILLSSLPLTSHGKIDRNFKPKLDSGVMEKEGISLKSEDDTVVVGLISIWRRLLDRTDINIGDDFFIMGGHSLLAIRAISEIRKMFNINISVSDFLDLCTIGNLARYINTFKSAEVVR